MRAGQILLSLLAITGVIGTAIADLGFMHAQNAAWPPHARLHALWAVIHLALLNAVALGLIWLGPEHRRLLQIRWALLIMLTNVASFLLAGALGPVFGARLTPDLPSAELPIEPLGLDGNLVSFLIATPLLLGGWFLCERAHTDSAA